jgi:hypothetical protein
MANPNFFTLSSWLETKTALNDGLLVQLVKMLKRLNEVTWAVIQRSYTTNRTSTRSLSSTLTAKKYSPLHPPTWQPSSKHSRICHHLRSLNELGLAYTLLQLRPGV